MDIVEKIQFGLQAATNSLAKVNDSFAKDAVKKKHTIRIRFYGLVKGYINSPGSESPNAFFDWYLEQLDKRMECRPQWAQAYFKVSGQKNEQSLRSFLEKCRNELTEKPSFTEVIKEWVPQDEYQIIASTSSSDISDVLDLAVEMAEEKQTTSEQIKGAIFSNLPLILIGVFFHWFIYSFIYKSFVTPGFAERKIWEDMTIVEQNYMIYEWFMNTGNLVLFIAVLVAVGVAIGWSIKNWHKRGVFIREHYIDYLPPYSLSKINSQYNILMVINNFMKSGKSFGDSVEKVLEGASPYVRMQVSKIISNSSAKANDAINIFYLGEYGSDVQERGNHIPLEQAIDSLLPAIKKSKSEKFDKTVKISMMVTFKPLIYLSFGYALIPVLMQIFTSLPDV